MMWWIALAVSALGLLFFIAHMWASVHNPEPDGSIEENTFFAGWIVCLGAALGLLAAALLT